MVSHGKMMKFHTPTGMDTFDIFTIYHKVASN